VAGCRALGLEWLAAVVAGPAFVGYVAAAALAHGQPLAFGAPSLLLLLLLQVATSPAAHFCRVRFLPLPNPDVVFFLATSTGEKNLPITKAPLVLFPLRAWLYPQRRFEHGRVPVTLAVTRTEDPVTASVTGIFSLATPSVTG